MVRAPNRYPSWLEPHAPVTVAFSDKMLTNFAKQYVEVGPPPAKLMYRVVEPGNYHFEVSSTNWQGRSRREFEFIFHATVPAPTNRWTAAPRGTVLLLHGYGLAQFSMLPWALRLGEDGWRCVLVDLRGHGESTGRRIYCGVRETNDMTLLLNALARNNELAEPVSVVGESYGAALALRWKTVEPRVHTVVAIAPYASMSNSVLNLCAEYADWLRPEVIQSGLKKLPEVLQIPASEFDTTTVLKRTPVSALFVAGGQDKITPQTDVAQQRALASPDSRMIVVQEATHESLTYYFSDLAPPVTAWLDAEK
jgi:pimeloyl-ACP methyl ester carboxylesterase